MQKTSLLIRTLLTAVTILTLCPGIAQAEMSVQILTTPDQKILPLEVEFEAVVSGGTAPYTYTWNFGDGGSSTLPKDSHYFRESGQYNVTLLVTDTAGGYGFASKTVTVSSSTFNPENAVFTVYSDTTKITSTVQDSRDSSILWVGTRGGLVRLNTVTDEKKFYLNELPDLYVKCIIQSSDKAIWIGTYSGLARFDYEKDQWTVFTAENSGLPYTPPPPVIEKSDEVTCLLQTSDEAIWVGTNDGLARFDYEKDQWEVFDEDNSELPFNRIGYLVQTSDGAVWVDSLARFDYEKNQWTVFNTSNSGLPSYNILSLLSASNGAIWVGTWDGLVRFDYEKDQWTVFNTDNSGLPGNSIWSLVQTSDGALWAGTSDGLACFDYGNDQWTVFNKDNSGLPFNSILSLLPASNGALWVGTWNGLVRFDYEKNQWTAFNTENCGLPDNINSLTQASGDGLWGGT
ncbi:MAG: two-component regulator propeller domain-containing protein, partial [Desulfococcaceae bacterium]|nr:two-component regulator propeller domain-containing protein [Desulfococcaceae bacterium]